MSKKVTQNLIKRIYLKFSFKINLLIITSILIRSFSLLDMIKTFASLQSAV